MKGFQGCEHEMYIHRGGAKDLEVSRRSLKTLRKLRVALRLCGEVGLLCRTSRLRKQRKGMKEFCHL